MLSRMVIDKKDLNKKGQKTSLLLRLKLDNLHKDCFVKVTGSAIGITMAEQLRR